ncbi:MAG: cobalamin biosynthesis protein [Magnetococcales bacterium]|nr:cobalamin biosynthesis protein [Magnetococcales bacterium]
MKAKWPTNRVDYRPPPGQGNPLAVGIGCDRDTPAASIRTALEEVLTAHFLSLADVVVLATIDLKADEPGLLALGHLLDRPWRHFPAASLATVTVPNPSATVMRHVGTPSVAEAAALLAAAGTAGDAGGGSARLAVEKWSHRDREGKNLTIAVAFVDTDTSRGDDPPHLPTPKSEIRA